MEYFDIVDENGNPTGEKVERSIAHKNGIPHRTAHVWIVRQKDDNIEILLQKRCMTKDSFPGCYDISSAGHIPAGEDYIQSALRELEEELGVKATPEELVFCGDYRTYIIRDFHGEKFVDNQYARIFLLWKDYEETEFCVQKEEIDSVKWMKFRTCKESVRNNMIPHCIDIAELEMIEEYL